MSMHAVCTMHGWCEGGCTLLRTSASASALYAWSKEHRSLVTPTSSSSSRTFS